MALIEKHADTGTLLLPGHFQSPTIGTIERRTEGFAYKGRAGS